MKNRYDGRKGKEEGLQSQRQKMYQSEHTSNNEFVKSHQAMQATMGMKTDPKLDSKYMEFDACMVNNGDHAQEFGRQLASSLDKKAFPVK